MAACNLIFKGSSNNVGEVILLVCMYVVFL